MIHRTSHLIGKSVMAATTGEKLGTVADLLFDDTDHHLIGVVVRQGWLNTEHVLPAEAVQTFGRDAVVSTSRNDLVTAAEWRDKHKEG